MMSEKTKHSAIRTPYFPEDVVKGRKPELPVRVYALNMQGNCRYRSRRTSRRISKRSKIKFGPNARKRHAQAAKLVLLHQPQPD